MATAARTRYTPAPKARNDAYTGLLFISFLALVISPVLLLLDYNNYPSSAAPKPRLPAPGSSQPPQEFLDATSAPSDASKPKDENPPKEGAEAPKNPG